GGNAWEDQEIIERLTRFVYEGKAFIGVNEPSAITGYDTLFRMAHILGVDMDLGDRVSHGRYSFMTEPVEELEFTECGPKAKRNIYLTDGLAKVLKEENGIPVITSYEFGKGRGIYLSSYEHSIKNARTLLHILLYAAGESFCQEGITDNLYTECAYYEKDKILVMINNSDTLQKSSVTIKGRTYTKDIPAFDTIILPLE
ncbi:MAG TPA: D-galactosyl-beta-1-4-L-rhamnose phosphorylase, partial [Lachnoclostridium phytofermentans]|nr:D-galactosyl-beta-1-4-L-rhamnose phosphorylase [Lachnoclostridium phytofermentans]